MDASAVTVAIFGAQRFKGRLVECHAGLPLVFDDTSARLFERLVMVGDLFAGGNPYVGFLLHIVQEIAQQVPAHRRPETCGWRTSVVTPPQACVASNSSIHICRTASRPKIGLELVRLVMPKFQSSKAKLTGISTGPGCPSNVAWR